MKNIWLVTKREYLSRVKKKSFLIMTLLGPLLIAMFYGAIFWIVLNDQLGEADKNIYVVDHSGLLENRLENSNKLKFTVVPGMDSAQMAAWQNDENIYGIIEVPDNILTAQDQPLTFRSSKSISVATKERVGHKIENALEDYQMNAMGISKGLLDSLQVNLTVQTEKLTEEGESELSNVEVYTAIGTILSFAIYFFIFLYGVQVMKGVIEEKTNRIVEIIVSCVKPFELMMGKVLGLAMVGLTQILIWILFTSILMVLITGVLGVQMTDMAQNIPVDAQDQANSQLLTITSALASLPIGKILFNFVFYFIGGYLLYSSLFAAIGAAVDNDTDTQQFMLPITLPLVFALVISMSVVMRDPNAPLAVWMSIIPLTSPIVMMVRTPFDPPMWQMIASMASLVGFFIFTIWVAGKIYRTGILMYGKKVSYKEIGRWLFRS